VAPALAAAVEHPSSFKIPDLDAAIRLEKSAVRAATFKHISVFRLANSGGFAKEGVPAKHSFEPRQQWRGFLLGRYLRTTKPALAGGFL
jgi:hypothetical protein